MSLKENKIKEYFLANASNYIYALISDNDIKNVFNGTQGAVIRRKREYQIAYIINSAPIIKETQGIFFNAFI